jgi:anti-sigma factor RsiW
VKAHPDPATLARLDDPAFGRRREVLAHLAACSRCRAAWAGPDPSRLFSLLATRPLPAALLDDVSGAVAAGLATGPAAARRYGRAWNARAVAALAAAVLLAVAMLFVGGDHPGSPQPVAQGLPAAPLPPVPGADLSPSATVAVLDSPGHARVIDLTVGKTQLVMIFDGELDL